jgi:adenine-specific DNA-methyltransferase
VKPDRSQEEILYEILLKAGFPLTAPVEKIDVAGKEVYAVEEGTLLVCLAESVNDGLLRGMVELEPVRVVCLDTAFHGNDRLKTNAVLEMKDQGIEFRTV